MSHLNWMQLGVESPLFIKNTHKRDTNVMKQLEMSEKSVNSVKHHADHERKTMNEVCCMGVTISWSTSRRSISTLNLWMSTQRFEYHFHPRYFTKKVTSRYEKQKIRTKLCFLSREVTVVATLKSKEMERVRKKLLKFMFNCFICSLVTKTEAEFMEMTIKVTKIALRIQIIAGLFGGSFVLSNRMTISWLFVFLRDTWNRKELLSIHVLFFVGSLW